jgi:hypothetical protein
MNMKIRSFTIVCTTVFDNPRTSRFWIWAGICGRTVNQRFEAALWMLVCALQQGMGILIDTEDVQQYPKKVCGCTFLHSECGWQHKVVFRSSFASAIM